MSMRSRSMMMICRFRVLRWEMVRSSDCLCAGGDNVGVPGDCGDESGLCWEFRCSMLTAEDVWLYQASVRAVGMKGKGFSQESGSSRKSGRGEERGVGGNKREGRVLYSAICRGIFPDSATL